MRAAQPDFAVTEETAPAVAAVCRRLDGLPLALELAAARVRLLPPPALLARLERRLPFLTDGARDAPPRHQTLRATMDWSHDLLTEPERTLFRRLSVFAGGFTLEAVEAVCGFADQVLDLLTGLVDKSLVQVDGADGAARYRLLETLREYGAERLDAANESVALRGRHLAWCIALAERAEAAQAGPEQLTWLDRIEREHDNLRAALDWCARSPSPARAAAGLRLGGALGRVWSLQGQHAAEVRRRLTALLESDRSRASAPCRTARAKAACAAGWLALILGDLAEARSRLEESLALARRLDDRATTAWALNHLGWLARSSAVHAEARALHDESLTLWNQLGDDHGRSVALLGLGAVAPDEAAARALYEESLELCLRRGDRMLGAIVRHRLGELALERGDWDAARAALEESLAFWRSAADRMRAGRALQSLGDLALARGEPVEARALLEESLALRHWVGDKLEVGDTLTSLALLAIRRGETAVARARLAEGLPIFRELGSKSYLARWLEAAARLAAAERRSTDALRLAGAAAGLREAIGARPSPIERSALEDDIRRARRSLADAGAAAWEEGRVMTPEQAASQALVDAPPAPPGRR